MESNTFLLRFYQQINVEIIRGFHGENMVNQTIILITHWEKLPDSDWLIDYEFKRNLSANSVIRGKLQISRAKPVIHSECKYEN